MALKARFHARDNDSVRRFSHRCDQKNVVLDRFDTTLTFDVLTVTTTVTLSLSRAWKHALSDHAL